MNAIFTKNSASGLQEFVYSVFNPVTRSVFHGHCFIDSDIVVGQSGHDDYVKHTGYAIEAGHDGCYISISYEQEVIRIGTDYTGYSCLFYYSQHKIWAFSNSFLLLVEHLQANGVDIKINYSHLATWFDKRSFGNQLVSHRTAAEGVLLLPPYKEIRVYMGGQKTSPFELVERKKPDGLAANYPDALADYIRIWNSRLHTALLNDSLTIKSDLTGGKDSRLVLALLMKASVRNDRYRLDAVTFNSQQNHVADLRIATIIGRHYGLKVNEGADSQDLYYKARDAYLAWKYDSLGIYSPVYIPQSPYNSSRLYCYGAGGEAHRPLTSRGAQYYMKSSPESFLDEPARHIPSANWHSAMKADVLDDLSEIMRHTGAAHPLVLHYRHFRDRIHGGRWSRRTLACAPLASRLLHRCSELISDEKFMAGQIMADLLFNLDPTLALFPYDKPKKTFSIENLEMVTRVSVSDIDTSGRLFAGEKGGTANENDLADRPPEWSEVAQFMLDDFESAAESVSKLGFFSQRYIDEARIQANYFLEAEPDHAVRPTKIVHVILAGELARPVANPCLHRQAA